eukprot:scaffold1154_cov310-Pinguiococcus_pyrenoidosus.AAC.46
MLYVRSDDGPRGRHDLPQHLRRSQLPHGGSHVLQTTRDANHDPALHRSHSLRVDDAQGSDGVQQGAEHLARLTVDLLSATLDDDRRRFCRPRLVPHQLFHERAQDAADVRRHAPADTGRKRAHEAHRLGLDAGVSAVLHAPH